eukprot:scaffold2245_cov232-Pinguiococcus_pyrenoidosus.AAC.4
MRSSGLHERLPGAQGRCTAGTHCWRALGRLVVPAKLRLSNEARPLHARLKLLHAVASSTGWKVGAGPPFRCPRASNHA